MSGHIFVSYASANKAAAEQVVAHLEQNGLVCWIAPRNITPGEIYARAIIGAIQHASVFLLIFTPESDGSEQVLKEVDRAVNAKVPLLPFRVVDHAPSDAMEYYLCDTHWLDAFPGPMEEKFPELVMACRRHCNAAGLPVAAGKQPATVSAGLSTAIAVAQASAPPCPPKRRWLRRLVVLVVCLMLIGNCVKKNKERQRRQAEKEARQTEMTVFPAEITGNPHLPSPPDPPPYSDTTVPVRPPQPNETVVDRERGGEGPGDRETLKRQIQLLSPEKRRFVMELPPMLKQQLRQLPAEERLVWIEKMFRRQQRDRRQDFRRTLRERRDH